jgi:single-strand DNA-binding protein
MNRAFLTGRIESLKEISVDVVSIQLVTSHKWVDKLSGEKKEEKEQHTVIFFNKMAHIIKKYSRIGMIILVEGYIKTGKETKRSDGVVYINKEIHAKSIEFMEPVRVDGNIK